MAVEPPDWHVGAQHTCSVAGTSHSLEFEFDSDSVRLAIEESIGAYIGDFVQKAIEGVVGSLWKKLG